MAACWPRERTSDCAAAETIPSDRIEDAVRLFFSGFMWHFLIEERVGAEEDPDWERHLEKMVGLVVTALRG